MAEEVMIMIMSCPKAVHIAIHYLWVQIRKYNAGVAKAGGLGRNHELRSAGARARKGHRGRAEDKDVKNDRLDYLCDATDPVYKEEDTVDGERKNQSKERVCTGSHRMEHTKGYERTKAYPEPKNSDPDLNQTWLPSPSPRDPGRDTKNQIVEQSQQPTQAKSVSKHEWLQSPSPQDSKITEGRWGAVNELNSHTVRQRCIQYSMRQYMVGPEFLTQATPERLLERIEQAAEGKHSQES
ncbi:hypothetical protein GGX14DRAFT_644245 [Mycena pura]|uniref:Uncharacterized protein n=1 Tax=Mycena pura TaxID=153505 RepID=A0AAD6VAK4_9AGAR|nr:hypothetical protein GGX14DRAFT_644245 [Mycena pura]